ncbi:hypothetical protein A2962_04540 [Candidatus Woesebacteria bacterium RIFCSPLOWO2_01_FULL_39_61]|uniref:PKD domain-containing protein n=1 Tax=Candidatus Woesebacteria bacterium RIFCSPHIGHO2_02_FULL_39_13 TaxID=1802505 RepID=A0A1F7YXD3_9BACT|nr:MAG: hypothetical protein A2692_05855 [Candidatus Woesebacteria bacterium RIFCSPHIGHO2_01_FULL_39_95]OGM31937.1 MAG: hypothetical protein A3D01_00710 [Candidatus Woesebacteria bacterium RIFCSPHIGHO2_02_FULL_39_13]OGM36501.1 MAG: hypothetical protein A3E13_02485 [Candidatus Woesebacteria bacterium RIFCSPHIGHO2_12_FULL_40_20]OGM65522.1 MAG: hypothetical protein A2962_04540 [Candidatus Woesebacteria bacterium RIFCSPLOWO2_01_FULL_39_61]OGM73187.1 MAG: hypothetical protein A3H19_02005 [Candidatus
MDRKFKLVTFLTTLVFLITFSLDFFSEIITTYANTQPPSFPSCTEKIFEQDGDWAHYDFGVHGVPGVANLEGSDDVYSLSGGNFLQCFCPLGSDQGIQSDWWRVGYLGLSESEIGNFLSQGWIKEQGSGWNLFDDTYLVKNSNFSCVQPTPTPTPTTIPTITPTPTTTFVPTATPTPGPEPEQARCTGLSVSPQEGTAPLTVRFTGSGFDKNGPILEYEFDFGDSSGFQPQVWKQKEPEAAHRYENPGTFVATVKVKDQAGIWRDGNSDCKKTITVHGKPQVLAAAKVKGLPEAGSPIGASGVIISLGSLGVYLYKRFKII